MLWEANEKCTSSWMMSEPGCAHSQRASLDQELGRGPRPSRTLLHALTQKGPVHSEPPSVHNVLCQALVISGSIPSSGAFCRVPHLSLCYPDRSPSFSLISVVPKSAFLLSHIFLGLFVYKSILSISCRVALWRAFSDGQTKHLLYRMHCI